MFVLHYNIAMLKGLEHRHLYMQRIFLFDIGLKQERLCFLTSRGRFVNVNDNKSAETTIQNQERVLFIARLQIKHGTSATI